MLCGTYVRSSQPVKDLLQFESSGVPGLKIFEKRFKEALFRYLDGPGHVQHSLVAAHIDQKTMDQDRGDYGLRPSQFLSYCTGSRFLALGQDKGRKIVVSGLRIYISLTSSMLYIR